MIAFTNVADVPYNVITSAIVRDGITNILKGVGSKKELFQESIFGHNSLPWSKYLSQYSLFILIIEFGML